ncbi:MAG: hypothetical protein WBE76_25595, partial [Terracidiphilus sp.]
FIDSCKTNVRSESLRESEALKGHGFSRATKKPIKFWALATEGMLVDEDKCLWTSAKVQDIIYAAINSP